MIRRVVHSLKKLVLGDSVRWHRVRRGPARGLKFLMHGPAKTQRILGLDEAEILSTVADLGRKCSVFIDIGSSDGYYSVLIGSLNSRCRLIPCDAMDEHKSIALGNLEANGIDSARVSYVHGMVGSGGRRLDDLAGPADGLVFVKIDVDGGEIDVLQSGEGVLARRDMVFVIETHSAELETGCAEFLTRHGYDVRIVPNAWWRVVLPDQRPSAHCRWLIATRLAPVAA